MKNRYGLTKEQQQLMKSYNIIDLFSTWFLTKKQKAKLQKISDEIKEFNKIAEERKNH
jgi:hypothetical protein